MGAVTTLPQADLATLPAILDETKRQLSSARTSAEVLEARDRASAIYDVTSRMTRRKAAHDHVMALALRLQGQALRIEARAKERLAEEYDAAQERGEVQHRGGNRWLVVDVDNNKPATAAALGLRRDEIHEARKLRDAERADPGAIDRSIDGALARGEAPTRALLKRDLGISRPVAPAERDVVAECRAHASYVLIHPYCLFGEDAENDADVRRIIPFLTPEERGAIRRAAAGLSLLAKELPDESV